MATIHIGRNNGRWMTSEDIAFPNAAVCLSFFLMDFPKQWGTELWGVRQTCSADNGGSFWLKLGNQMSLRSFNRLRKQRNREKRVTEEKSINLVLFLSRMIHVELV